MSSPLIGCSPELSDRGNIPFLYKQTIRKFFPRHFLFLFFKQQLQRSRIEICHTYIVEIFPSFATKHVTLQPDT